MDRMWTGKHDSRADSSLLILLVCFGAIFLSVSLCSGGDMGKEQHVDAPLQTIEQVPQLKWDALSQKKIFFGHQSVGNNIMAGVNELNHDHQNLHLHVVKTRDLADFDNPIFAHDTIGKNDYPLSKVQDFIHLMDDGLGNKLDIAFLKFCFVDIQSGTDIEHVFQTYNKSIDELKARYPKLTIVHFTVPLLRKENVGAVKKVKNFVNNLMGKKQDGFFSNSHNVARNKYNSLLVSHYGGKEPVFDLARLESTYPSGKRETFSYDGQKYYALVPAYTDDGGHLNKKGREYIAEQLLVYLADL